MSTPMKLFARLVLIPLDILALLWAIAGFAHRDWFASGVWLVFFVVTGMIGQSLHPSLSARELARGRHWEDSAEDSHLLSAADSVLLGRALKNLAFACAVVSALLWGHWRHNWALAPVVGIAAGSAVAIEAFLVMIVGGLVLRRRLP